MFKDFKEWRAVYLATKTYGQQMGYLQSRDPQREPPPPEQLIRSKSIMAARAKEQRQQTDQSQRTMMGH